MKRCTRMMIIALLPVPCLFAPVQAADNPVDQLRFKVNPIPYHMTGVAKGPPPHYVPKYIVYFITDALLEQMLGDPDLEPIYVSLRLERWLGHDPKVKDLLSEVQQELLRNSPGIFFWGTMLGNRDDNPNGENRETRDMIPWDLFPSLTDLEPGEASSMSTYRAYRFQAASEQDARVIVNQILKYANASARKKLDEVAALLTEVSKQVSELQAAIVQAEERIARLSAKQEEMQKCLGHTDGEFARQELAEVLRALRRLDVEKAGLEAKAKAIDKRLSPRPIPVPEILVDMQTELDVEMAGLLGQAETLARQRDEVQAFVDVPDQLEAARRETQAAKAELEGTGQQGAAGSLDRAAELAATVENPPLTMRPVELLDNTVILRPVEIVPPEQP